MTEIQNCILRMLEEVDSICRRNNIEYYLEGGSVLGAVRHGGFLPWDDDSDIAMTRSNWEKFYDAFKRENPENRALESPELNSLYPTVAMRYIDTSTTSIWRSLMYNVCACGVAVDIFILEDAPDDDDQLEQMKEDLIDYCEFANYYYRICSLGDGKRYKRNRKLSKKIGRERVLEQLNEKLICYNNQPTKRYLMRWGNRFQVYDKRMFGKPKYIPFENIMLPVPEQTYEYLNYQYGVDWYMIPAMGDEQLHDTIRDLEIGYQTYVDDYMPHVDKEKALNMNQKYKDLEMEVLDYNKAYHKHIYSVAGNATVLVLKNKLDKTEIDLDSAFSKINEENDSLFKELFGDYLHKQLYEWYRFYDVFVPVDDKVLGCVVSYLLLHGKMWEAGKLLDIRNAQKKPLSGRLLAAEKSYNIQLDSSCRFWEGNYSQAAQMLEQEGENAIITPAGQAVCAYWQMQNASSEKLKQLKKKTEQWVVAFPDEDLFKLLYAEILYRTSCEKSADMIINYLLQNSRHGMVRYIIKHKLKQKNLFNASDA